MTSSNSVAAILQRQNACALDSIPGYARAVIEALRFRSWNMEGLAGLNEDDWNRALTFCDRTKLTLPLGLRCAGALPQRVQDRVGSCLEKNAERWRRSRTTYQEIADALRGDGIPFAVLKGFSQCPDFIRDPRHRTQGDMDLLIEPSNVLRAREVAQRLGYESMGGFEDYPIDHLPRMIRRTGWRWRGDPFDVEMPLSLELHFRLWDARTERFAPEGLEPFWERREIRNLEGTVFPALALPDALAYSTLHLLRHLLRGDLLPSHVYELAAFLHARAADDGFWDRWTELHPESLRRIEAIGFCLACRWFDCALPDAAMEAIDRLPEETSRWLERLPAAPLASMFHPNKEEIWLHWSLLDSTSDRLRMLRRRLLPAQMPRYVPDPHAPAGPIDLRARAGNVLVSAKFIAARATRHVRSLVATAKGAIGWFAPNLPGADYFQFFITAALFNVGRYIFVLLFNLYLLRAGYRENVLGGVASAMTLGSLAGTWPAAMAIRKAGVRKMLLVAFPLIAGISILQAWTVSPLILVPLAFAAGLVGSAWAVGMSPAIAERTTSRNRAFGFSLIFSSGVGIGIAGGFFGGRLPGWFTQSGRLPDLFSYRAALFTSCAIVLLAIWPLSRMKPGASVAARGKLHRPGPLLMRFLIATAIWNLGTGAFNPFFNAYFARMDVPVARIGALFSIVHLVQAAAMLLAPVALRRFGMTRGVSALQAMTGVALLMLAMARTPQAAGIAYAFYMTAQYASEPGMYAFLMNTVPESERASASALNFIGIFGAQAIAQAASGILLARFGYPPVLFGAAVICTAGALLFRILFAGATSREPLRA